MTCLLCFVLKMNASGSEKEYFSVKRGYFGWLTEMIFKYKKTSTHLMLYLKSEKFLIVLRGQEHRVLFDYIILFIMQSQYYMHTQRKNK